MEVNFTVDRRTSLPDMDRNIKTSLFEGLFLKPFHKNSIQPMRLLWFGGLVGGQTLVLKACFAAITWNKDTLMAIWLGNHINIQIRIIF
jgi:hypothetical protein